MLCWPGDEYLGIICQRLSRQDVARVSFWKLERSATVHTSMKLEPDLSSDGARPREKSKSTTGASDGSVFVPAAGDSTHAEVL